MQKRPEERNRQGLLKATEGLLISSSLPPTIASVPPPPSIHMPQLSFSAANASTASHALLLPAPPLLPAAPEDMQVCVRTPRAERVTTSCSECRRRKQKCDQGRPCGNCVKRYPQPPCEYKQNKRQNPAVPREPAFKVVLPAQDYDYAKFSDIRSPMLPPTHQQRRRQHRPNTLPQAAHSMPHAIPDSLPSPPLQSMPLLAGTYPITDQTHFMANAIQQQRRHQQQFLQQQQQQQQWNIFTVAAAATGNNVLGTDPLLDRWQGLGSVASEDYMIPDTQMTEGSDEGGGMPALYDTGHTPAFSGSFPPTEVSIHQYGGGSHENQGYEGPSSGNTENNNGMFLLNLDHAAIIHHDVLSDAFQLLQARRSIPNELLAGLSGKAGNSSVANMDDFYAWLRILTWTAPGHYGHSSSRDGVGRAGRGRSRSRNGSESSISSGYSLPGTNLFQITGPAAGLAHLPLEATLLNADLARVYVKLISRFKSCLDGSPDPANPYTRIYVPYCLQTPLLAQVAIYTSACFLHETGHIDEMAAVAHKGRAIDMLNAQLHGGNSTSDDGGPALASTSDDAITAVIQLVMDEWYWGQTQNLYAHLHDLREMIRLRGGLRSLGMNGLVSKLAMASDMAVALSLEIAPVLQGNSHERGSNFFDYEELSPPPFRVSHNTPLVSGQPTFAQCAEPLDIHPTTASILDDMRFLITAVLALPEDPTAKDLQKVQTTAQWIHDRIQRLPDNSPEPPENNNTSDEEGGMLFAETQSMANRRPSIILSQAEPRHQPDQAIVAHGAQSPSLLDSTAQQHPQLSASPRSLTSHRGQSGSPHMAQLLKPSPTPPGSADGSLLSMSMSANNSRNGSAYNSRRGSAHSLAHLQASGNETSQAPWQATAPAATAAPAPPPPSTLPSVDPLYQAVRQTALIYARAILQRRPFSQVVISHDFVQLWTATWRVSLTSWKALLGVFMWVTLSIIASAHDTPHDLFVKSMLSICTVQMSLENWDVAAGALKAAVRLNAWLGRGASGSGSGSGSENSDASGSRRQGEQQSRQARAATAGYDVSGVAEFSMMEHHLRDSGATLPGWDP